jgi:pSer/pThr/pTyr-binding forkhead associated (FHA) protein
MKNYALRFISGKYQGGEVPLPPEAEIVIGRSSDLDMVLVEDMVSRRHAKMFVNGDDIVVQDLGSTNGTFVNGERIKRVKVNEGDRILIGTSIIKLVSLDSAAPDMEAGSRLEDMARHRRASQARSMSGTIDEIPLPDLIQLFGSSKKTAVLVVRTDDDVGKIHLREGLVVYASINDSEQLSPEKCAGRILTWRHGSFYMEPSDNRELPASLDLRAEEILMDSMRIFDEIQRLGDDLPPMNASLSLAVPLEAKLRELGPEELDVLQCAINHRTVESLFNNCPADDLDIAQRLVTLMQKGYLKKAVPEEKQS